MFPFETIVQIYLYKRKIQEIFHQMGQTRVSEYWFMAPPSSEKMTPKKCYSTVLKDTANTNKNAKWEGHGGVPFIYLCDLCA